MRPAIRTCLPLLAILLLACEEDGPRPLPELPVHAPFAAPADPLAGTAVESCAVIDATRCEAGALERCALYDTVADAFVADPDPLVRRAYRFERWYDLYQQPLGQTAERGFAGETPPGTPEEAWGDPAWFTWWGGLGDSAIWTGTALTAYALRYLQTGTEADYQRLERKTRQMLTFFDVTGIPGYLARYHYLMTAPGAPPSDRYVIRTDAQNLGYKDHVFEPAGIPDLDPVYTQGYFDGTTTWDGTPMWHGNPSIDQYSGPLTSLPLVYDLIRDDTVRDRIATHVTCYLKRLERIEIRNLQQNADALEAVQAFFASGALALDPGDLDFSTLDTVVAYVNRQPNSRNVETFDRTCPDRVLREPWRVIDATSDDFFVDLLNLVSDLVSGEVEREDGIDHIYAVSVRGGDAMHLIHLAAVAYWMTGEEQYREFLYRELVENLHAVEVAFTAGAMVMPRWCRSFYGSHITFAPWWSLLTLLGDSPLRTEMQRAFDVEMWQKEMWNVGNAKFELEYVGTVPEALATGHATALAEAVALVEAFGGNGGVLEDPRRDYAVDRQAVLDAIAPGNGPICPTEQERALCEDGFDIMGVKIPGSPITHACDGSVAECPLGDVCADPMAEWPLPPGLRPYEDFMWQRNPFKLGHGAGIEGGMQSPGVDMMEAYWLARTYGAITAGQGQVLAWQPAGACP